MFDDARPLYRRALDELASSGLFKQERALASSQGALVRVEDRATPGAPPVVREVLNFCSNNYLGLSADPEVVRAAHEGLDRYGFGLSSVRFISGTQTVHRELEEALARFLRVDDAILFSSAFDANGGLFEALLGEQDAVISDTLNHASIIDGIRLCKAERHRYPHADMAALEAALVATRSKRLRLVATDGVFSMDGDLAPLDRICELADRHRAIVMVDDSHATGFVGPAGRGTPEHFGVEGRVDLVTGTLGKALGGASGGFVAGRAEAVALLRQRARPYLFSNTLAPPIAAASLAVLDRLAHTDAPRRRLVDNARRMRQGLSALGFDLPSGDHPIVPVMLGDAPLAQRMAAELFEEGIYVVAFFYPVVPHGKARIRVQVSAAHEPEQIDRAIEAFGRVGRRLGVLANK